MFGTAIGFYLYGTQVCYQYLRFAIYLIRGIRGCPPNKMGFCTVKSVSCRGLASQSGQDFPCLTAENGICRQGTRNPAAYVPRAVQ